MKLKDHARVGLSYWAKLSSDTLVLGAHTSVVLILNEFNIHLLISHVMHMVHNLFVG